MQRAEWDARYAAEPTLWGAEPNQFVRARVAPREPGTCVDIACGNGRNAVWLARRGWRVTGLDISPVALDQAAVRAASMDVQVDWQALDVRDWVPPEPVDLMLVAYLHLPIPELITVLSRAGKALRAGGRLLYIGHARVNLERGVGGPSDAGVLAEIADLATAAAGLRVTELSHLIRQTDKGEAIDILLEATPWDSEDPSDIDEESGHR